MPKSPADLTVRETASLRRPTYLVPPLASSPRALDLVGLYADHARPDAFYLGGVYALTPEFSASVLEGGDTRCPKCGHLLIQRDHFSPRTMDMEEGRCSSCTAEIAGVFTNESS